MTRANDVSGGIILLIGRHWRRFSEHGPGGRVGGMAGYDGKRDRPRMCGRQCRRRESGQRIFWSGGECVLVHVLQAW